MKKWSVTMTPKQSLDWLRRFELSYSNVNHRFCNVDCWPIVRNTILSKINAASSASEAPKKNNFRFRSLCVMIWCSLKSLATLFKTKNADIFILSDNKFSEKIENNLYLNDAHAISDLAESKGESSLIALQGKYIDSRIVKRNRCVSIYIIIVISAFISRLSFLFFLFPALIKYINNITKSLNAHFVSSDYGDYHVEEKQLLRNIIFCIVASTLFSLILKRINPSRTYVVCYYSLIGMAFCSACNRLEIPVSDLQHGVSGRNMRAYSNWNNCPEYGYTTLPKYFLTWTRYDTKAINDTLNDRNGFHCAITSGHIWEIFKEKFGLDLLVRDEWSEFLSVLTHYKRKIVVTLQSSSIPENIFNIINDCGSDCCFLIRAHPNFSTGFEMEQLLKLESDYANVLVSKPTQVPIQLLMSIADVNITGWSASVYDAYFEGVRSIVVTKFGLDYFSDFIDDFFVVYTEDVEKIKKYALNLTVFTPLVDKEIDDLLDFL
ncbi:hypothetical protein [Halomonas sp. CSM-2]|uniref:hypothetical protein n=1 Tax=Halomonas sp. CSM-2 TaxID=1975722 RepID=UPI001592D509|nr:hypothetical protein [Halomonas sp. CSM-2]